MRKFYFLALDIRKILPDVALGRSLGAPSVRHALGFDRYAVHRERHVVSAQGRVVNGINVGILRDRRKILIPPLECITIPFVLGFVRRSNAEPAEIRTFLDVRSVKHGVLRMVVKSDRDKIVALYPLCVYIRALRRGNYILRRNGPQPRSVIVKPASEREPFSRRHGSHQCDGLFRSRGITVPLPERNVNVAVPLRDLIVHGTTGEYRQCCQRDQ